PRRLQSKVPRDPETICLKCLHKDAKNRYASAEALADDLDRYLAGQPIQARPAGLGERALKWVRRRPAAAALLLVCTLVAVILASGGWWYSAAERARALREEKQRQAAEADFRLALDAVDQLLRDVGSIDLADVPQLEPVREKVLHRALGFYEKFLRERGQDASVRLEAARAYGQLGDIQALLGK